MIRFLCPSCSRRYELPEALARLPLVCKGCGQPLAVPETSTEPEAKPEPPKPAPSPPKPESPKVVAPPPPPPKPAPPKLVIPTPSPPPVPAPKPVTVETVESRLPPPDHAHTNGQPYPKNGPLFEQPELLEALEIAPPAPPVVVARPANSKVMAAIVDGLVAIVLLAIGVFCGELLARQSTSEVLRNAGSAAKFPPIDFLMWLAPPVLFLLIYSLLISRGKSVGSYVRRIENVGLSSKEEVPFYEDDHSFRRALMIGALAFAAWILGVRAWNADAEVLGTMTFQFFAPAIATGILVRGRFWSWLLIGAVYVVALAALFVLPILTRLPK